MFIDIILRKRYRERSQILFFIPKIEIILDFIDLTIKKLLLYIAVFFVLYLYFK